MMISSINTKENILNSAIYLFAENGYTESSMRLIANRAGIRESSIYHHFASKQELLDCITEEYIKLVKENLLKFSDFGDRTPSIEEITDILCFKFPRNKSKKSLKMLQIIWQEQFRSTKIQSFFSNTIFSGFNDTFKELLQELSKFYDIQIDNDSLCSIINSILLTYSLETCHNPNRISCAEISKNTKNLLKSFVTLTFIPKNTSVQI